MKNARQYLIRLLIIKLKHFTIEAVLFHFVRNDNA